MQPRWPPGSKLTHLGLDPFPVMPTTKRNRASVTTHDNVITAIGGKGILLSIIFFKAEVSNTDPWCPGIIQPLRIHTGSIYLQWFLLEVRYRVYRYPEKCDQNPGLTLDIPGQEDASFKACIHHLLLAVVLEQKLLINDWGHWGGGVSSITGFSSTQLFVLVLITSL